jgi:hypothetical protein
MENMVNYIFITGCARSGTSILGELIASHPEVKYIFEASNIWEMGGMGENESHRLTARHATEAVKKQVRGWFESQAKGTSMLVEKNPRNSLRVPYVKEIFPEAKFIHIVRDGRDVACSMVPGCGGAEWGHLKPPSWQEYYKNYSGATRCAHAWKQVLETALDDLSHIPHIQVRYEDLLASTLSVTKTIFNFLELDIHANTLEFCKKTTNNTSSSYHAKYQDRWYRDDHTARVGRWHENLNAEEKQTINSLLKPLLTELGYINEEGPKTIEMSISAKSAGKSVTKSGNRLIAVLGMHRSGTSALTRGLQVLGVELGDRLIPPSEGVNEKGFWEDIDLNWFNSEMLNFLNSDWHFLTPIQPADVDALRRNGFLMRAVEMLREKTSGIPIFGFKDPRVAKLLPFWKEVFVQSGLTVSYVLTVRHPLSVYKSLAKRDGFESEKSHLLWLGHVIDSLMGTAGEKRTLVDYDRLMQSPEAELTSIARKLQLQIDLPELEKFKTEFLDNRLRHTVYQPNDLISDEAVSPLAREVYVEVLKVATGEAQLDSTSFKNKTARWSEEFSRQKSALVLADKLTSKIISMDSKIISMDSKIISMDSKIISMDSKIVSMVSKIISMNQVLAEKEQAIQELSRQVTDKERMLREIANSRAWKFALLLRKIRVNLLPPGSQREKLIRWLYLAPQVWRRKG